MFDAEWIAARRAEMKASQEQAIAHANQMFGGLKLLDEMEAQLLAASASNRGSTAEE